MSATGRQVNGYIELAPPQILDDNWRELAFGLAPSGNILQDYSLPESGSGYVFKDAHLVGSAVHNRFLYWRMSNDILELIEISSEVILEGNQVRITFANSPIINDINVIEFHDSIVLIIATFNSVHRLHLPHPKTTNKSILFELRSDLLYDLSNYYILNTQNSTSQQPICAASWQEKSTLKCALSFPDSSIIIVQFSLNSHHITTFDIKQTGIIGRLWSRMPNLWARSPNDCDNAVFVCQPFHHQETDDVLLFTLCRDCKIRVFSTNSRECVYSHNMIPQSSFSQSFASHTNPTTELPMMKIHRSQIIIYLTENRPEFVFLDYSFSDGQHSLKERATIQAPSWEKLIDFAITRQKLWALATMRETESTLCYMELGGILESEGEDFSIIEGMWDFVNQPEETELPNSRSLVAEIFWSNHFSVATVQKALVGIAGPTIPKKTTMQALEELAFTRIVNDDQDEAWTRFYNYCLQNHYVANKSLGIVAANDESVISVVKRSNPSFICPWLTSVDMILQGGPYRGMEFPSHVRSVLEPLNYISTEIFDDECSSFFEQKVLEDPSNIFGVIRDTVSPLSKSKRASIPRISSMNRGSITKGIDYICHQLDLTAQAEEYHAKFLGQSKRVRSEHSPLSSNAGIIVCYELFRRLVRARMILARDLLVYLNILSYQAEEDQSDGFLSDLCQDLHTSGKIRSLTDSLRCYAILVWMAESPIKCQPLYSNTDVINFVSVHFEYFNSSSDPTQKSQDNILDRVVHQNLFMKFLFEGGVNFSWIMSEMNSDQHLLSCSFYVTDVAINLSKLLWPKASHICLAEFMITHQLGDHLAKYLDLTQEWLSYCEQDRHFIRAVNCVVQNRAQQAVEILNRLWMNIGTTNLLGRFCGLSEGNHKSDSNGNLPTNSHSIHRYYEKLIQLFQKVSNRQCLILLINHCLSLLESEPDDDQQDRVNSLRAKLFQYYLELEEYDDAYHTMVLTTDSSLRTNCLRKFIVSHCEKENWSNLLSYPFIDIKSDFIDILNQKAANYDLSNLNDEEFYKTSYYDLLFASYISDEEYKKAAEIMYSYALRLAQEVPDITSIRKQADCMVIALNALRCIEEKDRFVDNEAASQKDLRRPSVLKRSHDSESTSNQPGFFRHETSMTTSQSDSRITCTEIEKNYELTRARLRLLERDQTANSIALSPLRPEEIITQLVASSMFCSAMDLALLFKVSMDPILDGLTSKYMLVMRLSAVDIAVHQDIEKGLSDLFTNSYSIIDTYNYIANSTSPLVDRLWRLIDYYLTTYDGIGHRYESPTYSGTFSGTTVLMKVVASKLLAAGYEVPASLKRMYMSRNTAELLKLFIKFDRLSDAADLATEMINRVIEPSNTISFGNLFSRGDPPPVYLPTHLILLLITYLNEDATNIQNLKAANALSDKLDKFRAFLKS